VARRIARTVEECHDELDRVDRDRVWIFVRLVHDSSQRVVLADGADSSLAVHFRFLRRKAIFRSSVTRNLRVPSIIWMALLDA
jgi:hypothetical protein